MDEQELYALRTHPKVSEYRTEMLRYFMDRKALLSNKLMQAGERDILAIAGELNGINLVLEKL